MRRDTTRRTDRLWALWAGRRSRLTQERQPNAGPGCEAHTFCLRGSATVLSNADRD